MPIASLLALVLLFLLAGATAVQLAASWSNLASALRTERMRPRRFAA